MQVFGQKSHIFLELIIRDANSGTHTEILHFKNFGVRPRICVPNYYDLFQVNELSMNGPAM
jgi:hypothetical protein